MPVFKSSHISFRLAVERKPGGVNEDACDDDVDVVDTIFVIWGDKIRSRLILNFFLLELILNERRELNKKQK